MNLNTINTYELNKKINKDINLIDIREKNEYERGHVPGSKNIPMMDLAINHEDFLNKKDVYYLICQSGGRSMNLINFLREYNYNLVNVDGGTSSYGLSHNLEV